MKPLHDRIIVERLEPETVTTSGIVIPDMATEKPDRGRIIAVGTGKYDDYGNIHPLEVKVGDLVLFGKYVGQAFKVDGKELLTMRESDIIGLIDE